MTNDPNQEQQSEGIRVEKKKKTENLPLEEVIGTVSESKSKT